MKHLWKKALALMLALVLTIAAMAVAEDTDAIDGVDSQAIEPVENEQGIESPLTVPAAEEVGEFVLEEPGEMPAGEEPADGDVAEYADLNGVETWWFIAGDVVVALQEAVAGDEIQRPEDPVAPEGMAFDGWYLEDGTRLFVGDVPVIANPDPLLPDVNVFALFVEAGEPTVEVAGEPAAAPAAEEPVVEEPVEAPVEEEPAVEEPVEAPVEEEPAVEEPAEAPVEAPVVEEPVEAPVEEEPAVEEPVEASAVEEPAVEEPVEAPVEEEPAVEEPVEASAEEEPAVEEPVEAPVKEEPAVEEPAEAPVEAPVVEEPVEAPVEEEPAVEEPVEASAVEEPAVEEPVEAPVEEEPAVEEPVEASAVEEPAVEEIAEEPADEEPAEEEPIVEPTANVLTYSGEAQALVSGQGGWLYSLDGEIYGEEIPTAVNAGEYTVYFKATEADEPQSINVTVAKANVEFTPPVAAVG